MNATNEQINKRDFLIETLDIVRHTFSVHEKMDALVGEGYISENFYTTALGRIEDLLIQYLGATEDAEAELIGDQLFAAKNKADVTIIVDAFLQRKAKPVPTLVKGK